MPYHVSRTTAEYYQRGGKDINGRGHLTNMFVADRPRYQAQKLRIVKKRLGDGSDRRLEELQAYHRKCARMEFLNARGEWREQTGRPDRAERSYQLAARTAPWEIAPFRKLGALALSRGSFAKAVSAYACAVNLKQAEEEDFFNLAVALAASGNPAEGRKVVEAIPLRLHTNAEALEAIRVYWEVVLKKFGYSETASEGHAPPRRAAG
jgi:Flp pilus assembly protein TadD